MILPEAKDPRSLLVRLKERRIGDTREQINSFWEDLTHAIEECMEQWKKGHGQVPQDLTIIINIVDEILQVCALLSYQ